MMEARASTLLARRSMANLVVEEGVELLGSLNVLALLPCVTECTFHDFRRGRRRVVQMRLRLGSQV